MKIPVNKWQSEEDITVQVLYEDGDVYFCNHGGAEIEEVDFGYADPIKCDWVDDWRDALVCDKCGEVTEVVDTTWDFLDN